MSGAFSVFEWRFVSLAQLGLLSVGCLYAVYLRGFLNLSFG